MLRLILCATLTVCLSIALIAGDGTSPTQTYPENAYFGDLHVHTLNSLDAYGLGTRETPDDAYRFAKGEMVNHSVLGPIQLETPLDFAAVTDHSEFFGIMAAILDPRYQSYFSDIAKEFRRGSDRTRKHSDEIFTGKVVPPDMLKDNEAIAGTANLWSEEMAAADRHDQSENFTAFVAYEYTLMPISGGNSYNLHRNVIFKEKGPVLPWNSLQYPTPEELWTKMEQFRTRGLGDVLAISHNANLSGGLMYAPTKSNGKPIDRDYAVRRSNNEPLAEMMQTKGASETHTVLASEDEYANFELKAADATILGPGTGTNETATYSYIRQAFKHGLAHEAKVGANPFKQGVIGSTDTHNGTPGRTVETSYQGQHGNTDNTPELRLDNNGNQSNNPGALAGVWATENSRPAIFDALRRRETFATSGTRLRVRFFGGWDLDQNANKRSDMIAYCYDNGVPMGANMPAKKRAQHAVFVVWAFRDPASAPLDRIQIVKGWLAKGQTHEEIFDVVTATAQGQSELSATWKDPKFDPNQRAFYYARVLEKPVDRWSAYDAKAMNSEPPAPVQIQERAWSSAIWYTPAN